MDTCLNCRHGHVSKDFEFELASHDPRRNGNPDGRCWVNIDLYWCDKPETEDDDFQVLCWGTPSGFYKDVWFPQLATICEQYQMEEAHAKLS